jgi:hypothetical protein
VDSTADRQFGEPKGCGHPDLWRTDDGAGRQHDGAGQHVLAAGADVHSRGGCAVDAHDGDAAVGAFDLDDGVRARRHRGAGHDPRRRTGRQRPGVGPAGRDVLGYRQRDGQSAYVLGAYRVTVHRGVGEWRQVDRRHQVVGQHETDRLAEREQFGGSWREQAGDDGGVLLDGAHGRHPACCGWGSRNQCGGGGERVRSARRADRCARVSAEGN